MSTIYITSDLHFGHKKIYPLRGFSSIEEHNNTIIDNWNSIINKRDSTFILGDIAFGATNIKLLNKLNGYKKLILGNHDSYNIKNYIDYCTQIFGAIKYKDCILTHIPVHESQLERHKYNIHGHLHDKSLNDKRYFCVSLEQNGLYPFKLNDILTLLNKTMYIKLTEDAKALQEILKVSFIPYRATPEAAAFDLRACIGKPVELYPNEVYKFPTGVHIHLNDANRCALYLPRSSNNDLILTNTIGLLDADYIGESYLKYKNIGNNPIIIHPGERIGQLLILNCIHPTPIIVKELNETKRSGGFGSTGKV